MAILLKLIILVALPLLVISEYTTRRQSHDVPNTNNATRSAPPPNNHDQGRQTTPPNNHAQGRHTPPSNNHDQVRHTPPSNNHEQVRNTGDIQYRLTRLEVLLVEKLDNLRTEVRETGRRLQALEWQSTEVHSILEGLRVDINRLAQQTPVSSATPASPTTNNNQALEHRVDNLAKGVQILVVATRGLTSDVSGLKKHVSLLSNDTRSVLRMSSNLVTKQFFNNGILELKHRQIQGSPQTQSCPSSPQTSAGALPKNCKDVLLSGLTQSGVYHIKPEHSEKSFMVVCDLQTNGGGWTVIHNRFEGTQDFYQNWHEYKHGFGNLGREFWLGLDNIHHLTGHELNELMIMMQDFDLQNKTAYYTAFSIGPEVEGYPLKILGGYAGDAGDSMLYHAGNRFSTKDMDQDEWAEGSCAKSHGGGWWYRSCDMSNLNGRYLSGELPEQYIYQGMYWGEFRGPQYSLSAARMLIRPREQINPLLFNEIFSKNVTSPSAQSDDDIFARELNEDW